MRQCRGWVSFNPAMLFQQLCDGFVLKFDRQGERCSAVELQAWIDLRVSIEQPLCHVQHPVLGRFVQRREIIDLKGVDIRAMIEKEPNDPGALVRDGGMQRHYAHGVVRRRVDISAST